ncbi:hypothetical protein [uncultured Campylobacter sp.]|uniref:hypothetical protein n=1 Tax=uncultured Campylobacter sp. TaxID=218934 RepID=UPI00260CF1C9|nr:hypothetical protein [uncultured Campylobacter sp.]
MSGLGLKFMSLRGQIWLCEAASNFKTLNFTVGSQWRHSTTAAFQNCVVKIYDLKFAALNFTALYSQPKFRD